jgi:hypothetical protein
VRSRKGSTKAPGALAIGKAIVILGAVRDCSGECFVAEALVRICDAPMTKALPGGLLAFRAQTMTLLDPAGRRSLTNANRGDRECRMWVIAEVGLAGTPTVARVASWL